jgi:hypothetical protein
MSASRKGKGMIVRGHRLATAMLLTGMASCLAPPAWGVLRTCGSDPVVNTSSVLCASPSGPCTATTVLVSAPIDVTAGGCTFDLGGRALIVDRTFDMANSHFIRILNAGDVSITATGKLKARGDGVTPILAGGDIRVESSGAVSNDGVIDVTGDPGGTIELHAADDIDLLPGSELRGVGISSSAADGARFADGAGISLVSGTGRIIVDGEIVVNGQNAAQGGDVLLQAAGDVEIRKVIDANGGGGDGGSIEILAGDDITISKNLNLDSTLGGGSGGALTLSAGLDTLGGSVAGGTVTLLDGTMNLSGSSSDGVGGDGGELRATAAGALLVTSDVDVIANAGVAESGAGGVMYLSSGDTNVDEVGSLDGDLVVEGLLRAKSGGSGGAGGVVTLHAGRDLTLEADVDLGGKARGGTVEATAGGAMSLASPVLASATEAAGDGGGFSARACDLTVDDTGSLEAVGNLGGQILLTGRRHLTIDADSAVHASGAGGRVELITRGFGTCSNQPSQTCLSNADCTVGCSTGTCVNVNPNTGGTLAQFDPAPQIGADPALPACP